MLLKVIQIENHIHKVHDQCVESIYKSVCVHNIILHSVYYDYHICMVDAYIHMASVRSAKEIIDNTESYMWPSLQKGVL